jgi:ribosomal protein S27E
MSEKITDIICGKCRLHTIHYKQPLGGETYAIICSECGTACVVDKDGKDIPREKINKDKEDWQ